MTPQENISNTFEFEQGPLLKPQSSEFMSPVDQGNLRVSLFVLVTMQVTTAQLILRVKIPFTSVILFTMAPESQQAQSSSTDLSKSHDFRPRLPPRDYHEEVIQNKIPPEMRCIPLHEPAV